MYRTRIILKQQTPMLHFQHDQNGATIRATEIKAKMDKNIYEREWKTFESGKEYLIGYDSKKETSLKKKFDDPNQAFRALDYKIRVIPKGKVEIWTLDKKKQFPGYFGNMGTGKGDKHLSFCKSEIVLDIRSFHPEIIEVIKKRADNFFQLENFGTRQSKGYGCFQIDSIDGEKVKNVKSSHHYFSLRFGPVGLKATYLDLFDTINYFYRTLRSGLNIKGKGGKDVLYFKSLLFQYAKSGARNHTWDKKEIRLGLFHGHPKFKNEVLVKRTEKDGTVQYTGKEPFLYRDLLGLSSSQDWQSYGATVEKKSPEIDRFRSPVLFKPIYQGDNMWRVYIRANDISNKMINAEFTIENAKRGGKPVKLTTPEFDLEDYLHFAFNFFKDQTVEDYIDWDGQGYQEVIDDLTDIYDQLKDGASDEY